MTEYVVFKTSVISSKKDSLPRTQRYYLSDSLYSPSFTKNINEAYRIYELSEAKETANLLDGEVGKLELRAIRV